MIQSATHERDVSPVLPIMRPLLHPVARIRLARRTGKASWMCNTTIAAASAAAKAVLVASNAEPSDYSTRDVKRFRNKVNPCPSYAILRCKQSASSLVIIGCSHYSQGSTKFVKAVLSKYKPSVTMLELDDERAEGNHDPMSDSNEFSAAICHPDRGRIELIDLPNYLPSIRAHLLSMPIEHLVAELLTDFDHFRFRHTNIWSPRKDAFTLDYRNRVMAVPLARQLAQPNTTVVAVVGHNHVCGLVRLLMSGPVDQNPQPPTLSDACSNELLRKRALVDALYSIGDDSLNVPRCCLHMLLLSP